jgi:DNA repair protein NreA
MAQFFETKLCTRCRGKGWCGKPCMIYSKIKDFTPKTKLHFSGNSPPEIFVGRYNYPNINAGILSPENLETSDTQEMAMPELWHENKLSIDQILTNRAKLIYGKFQAQIKQTKSKTKFTELMQEISMAYKSVSTEFFLKKAPRQILEVNKHAAVIGNPAPLQYARLQENPKIHPKVDYLVSDSDSKAVNSITELYNSKIPVSNIIKILSAGLLGLKTQRKLVPTRWSITATDDTISKQLLKKIKYYPEINEILLFHSYYIGNQIEILMLPDKFAFEVAEISMIGSTWQPDKLSVMKDYESFNGRKTYAANVVGAYYTNRLTVCEYLENIKKQATVFYMHEEQPEYNAPLGVGIIRETARQALKNPPEKFETIQQALVSASLRLKTPIQIFTNNSQVLRNYKKQTRLNKWF